MTLDSSILLRAAELAAGTQQYPKGALYVVATPIGNLADFSLRAIHLLAIADRIACEDTRVTSRLLSHFGLSKPLLPAHEHNEAQAAEQINQALSRGERVAFVSDAGTPGVSDPGARLVALARQAGYPVIPLPGASAVATAMSVAGDAQAQSYVFVGFLPHKGEARRVALQHCSAQAAAIVLFESPHRIETLARELAQACGSRMLTCCRELTKQFESIETMPAASLPAWLEADPHHRRGEFVLVLHARQTASQPDDDATTDSVLKLLLEDLPVKRAVAVALQLQGGSRNTLYQRALALKGDAVDEAARDDDHAQS